MKTSTITLTILSAISGTSLAAPTSFAEPAAQPGLGGAAGLITGWSQTVTYCNRGWGGNGECEKKGKRKCTYWLQGRYED